MSEKMMLLLHFDDVLHLVYSLDVCYNVAVEFFVFLTGKDAQAWNRPRRDSRQ